MKAVTSTRLVRDLQSVKNQLRHGPLRVTTHGKDDFVLVSKDEFERLTSLRDTDAESLDHKLRVVMDSISTLILIVDRNLTVRRANKAWRIHLEVEDQEIVGRDIRDFLTTTADLYLFQRIKNVLATQVEESFEMPSSHRVGRVNHYVIRPWPNGVAFFATDVTERIRATERILRNAAFDKAIEAVDHIAIGGVDETGKFIFATESLSSLIGSSRDTLLDASLFSILDRECRASLEEALDYRGMDTQVLDVRYMRYRGELRKARLALSPYSGQSHGHCFSIALIDRE